ncbi:MAG TPA: hypothetical protein PLJ70_01060 [Methylotenera sp.]|jgi:hypothetical protein|nr:hypothetical protein [Methylotenera sp.]HQS42990.1 hypothetical protein [Methylotenera sp.]
MKQLLVVVMSLVMLSACVVVQPVPPGQAKGCGYGPGNSESAPGQVKKNCR